jgi:B12-binding domain/radical SAM domain protein
VFEEYRMLPSKRESPDVLFLHAPSVYDFRKRSIVYGPVSDLIPSTPIFEMYPVGFSSMAAYLKRHGISVRIINIALLMLRDPSFDAEALIRRLHPKLVGIDLHWLPHCHGSIEVAKIVKKHHPETPVVFGGFSSSYFHEELVEYPAVDFVIRGDSAEEPLRRLFVALSTGESLDRVPNLTWKTESGEVRVNAMDWVPDDIDEFDLGYQEIIRSVLKYRDLTGVLPFTNFLDYPIMAAIASRGCDRNCCFCGGSDYAFKGVLHRSKTAYRSPEALVQEAKNISRFSRGPLFVIGDLLFPGADYTDQVLAGLGRAQLSNQIIFEFFAPPPAEFYARVEREVRHHSYEMSVESHDEGVRAAIGKGYSNQAIEESIGAALEHNCERFDLYFLVGLPKQTKQTVMETVEYCDHLYKKFGGDPRIRVFISPLAPFLDPGSRGFEQPERLGYKLLCHTLEEHRQALLQPSWKYTLNYATEWMTREEIVDVTYEAALGLNEVKRRWGVVEEKEARENEERIRRAVAIMKRVDAVVALGDPVEQERRLSQLKAEVDGASISTVVDKRELEWSLGRRVWRFRPWQILRIALSRG